MKPLPIGISHFQKLVEGGYLFVDTTPFIKEVFHENAEALLFTRPRRFGKTLNMTMLQAFFDHSSQTGHLFKGLKISQDLQMMELLNSLPVIYMSLRGIRDRSWEGAKANLMKTLSILYGQWTNDLPNGMKNPILRTRFETILQQRGDLIVYKHALSDLIHDLFLETGKKPLLLIDEYDVPIHSAWVHGYYDEMIDFMQVFLTMALKDNAFLFKGVLTGIYRVAKEDIFSGLNNLKVYTVMDDRFSNYFGFTQQEVDSLVSQTKGKDHAKTSEELALWYNGYHFGKETIYNPWSVLNYLDQQELKVYWLNTSSNELIIRMIQEGLVEKEGITGLQKNTPDPDSCASLREGLEVLINGGRLKVILDDSTPLRNLKTSDLNTVWNLFLFSGYLKAERAELDPDFDIALKGEDQRPWWISVPNREVMRLYQKTVLQWLNAPDTRSFSAMMRALSRGEIEGFSQWLKDYAMNTLSYFDIHPQAEITYHNLLLGILAQLSDEFEIRSNRESGKGRYDIAMRARKSDWAILIEVKGNRDKLDQALEQIDRKAYAQELIRSGCNRIMKVAVGVEGKEVEVLYRI